jgi:NAD(P)-dependent dehydrogenase (short-subunit alcohol dehydrogenase family)
VDFSLQHRVVAQTRSNPTALVTGSSRGLGLASTLALARAGWDVVMDARGAEALENARSQVDAAGRGAVIAVVGDVADREHRRRLREAVSGLGAGLDLLVNNASLLGPSPQPGLADYPLDTLEQVYRVNVLAPLSLLQELLPMLRARSGRVVNVSSDAAVEAYPGWGGYGSAKAALDQLTAVLAVELTELRIYSLDPGDMNTAMHAAAFPGQDISDLPMPETVVPALIRLATGDLTSGRYRGSDLLSGVGVPR